MGAKADSINWDDFLKDLKPKPGDNGDCFSMEELSEKWATGRDAARRLISLAVRSGLLAPVKISAPNIFGDMALRHRYRVVRKPSKRK